jgi:uncharacterized protein involved in exopolysaccharide biosynthesis
MLVKNRKLIGIITATSTSIALVTAFLLTPVYRAEVLLAPTSYESTDLLGSFANQFGGVANFAGIELPRGKDKTQESIAALNSRSLSVAYINERNLKPVMFPGKWNDEEKKWKSDIDTPTDWEAFEVFDKSVRKISFDKKTGLVTLTISWKEPVFAAKWANELVERVNARLRNEAIEEAEKNIRYLEKQITTATAVEVQQAIYRLIEAQTKVKMVAATRDQYAFTVIDAAIPPEKRVWPKRTLITTAGLIIGLTLGISVVLARKGERGLPPKKS